MRFSSRNITQSTRYRSPLILPAELDSVHGGSCTGMDLTVHDPRTPLGVRVSLSFTAEDLREPLMIALLARLCAQIPTEMRAEFDRIVKRESDDA